MTNKELAELIFPEIHETIEDLEKRYPKRNLPKDAEVTRFAPSPTGFLHTGSLFTAMICQKVAKQSGGIFYVRLEDTDTKREIAGSGEKLLSQLKLFDVYPNEGYMADHEEGEYGPYCQSDRASIYKICIKHLIEIGRAYPDFCSPEDLEEIRKKQEALKLNPGYYGEFARDRSLSNEERKERILKGEPYVIRFKSEGDHNNKITVHDLVHGYFDIAQNDQDIVILKSDGLPTYHFAHAVDDHFMRTTTVIRGEEWISSFPIHVELFEALGFEAPKYAHLPVIMKLDEVGHRRKLSKRLDNEAAVSYFIEDGYPTKALIIYLMTIANSNFEEWLLQNGYNDLDKFIFSFDKMSLDGALFDLNKLQYFAKEILGYKNKDEILEMSLDFASKYDPELLSLIERDREYFKEIMNIDREKENPRKDHYCLRGLKDYIGVFYEDIYDELLKQGFEFNEKYNHLLIASTLEKIRDTLSLDVDEQGWFQNIKEVANEQGFAIDRKAYKANPDAFKGQVGDVAEMLRVALTGRKNTPTLYYVMKVIGEENSKNRLSKVISSLTK